MHREFNFPTRDGVRLFGQSWAPETPPRAGIVLLHGFGDYSGRYEYAARFFNRAGVSVCSFDQRGHGRSPGRRAYIGRFETWMDDLSCFLAEEADELGAIPWFFFGHSMGGMLLARYLETNPTTALGAIFSSPFVGLNGDVPAFLTALAPFLSRWLPWLPVGHVDNRGLSRDLLVVDAADRDLLTFHGRVAARTGAEFLRIITAIHEDARRILSPSLIFHGSADTVVQIGRAHV